MRFENGLLKSVFLVSDPVKCLRRLTLCLPAFSPLLASWSVNVQSLPSDIMYGPSNFALSFLGRRVHLYTMSPFLKVWGADVLSYCLRCLSWLPSSKRADFSSMISFCI